MASVFTCMISPTVALNSGIKPRFGVRIQNVSGGDSTVLTSDVILANVSSFVGKEEKNGAVVDGGNNGKLKHRVEKKWEKDAIFKDLEILWDDGYGTKTVKDYLDGAKEIFKLDGGPPRWFCPSECGQSLKDSPILLFLPGNFSLVEMNSKVEFQLCCKYYKQGILLTEC